jgi:hypothetical protein
VWWSATITHSTTSFPGESPDANNREVRQLTYNRETVDWKFRLIDWISHVRDDRLFVQVKRMRKHLRRFWGALFTEKAEQPLIQ